MCMKSALGKKLDDISGAALANGVKIIPTLLEISDDIGLIARLDTDDFASIVSDVRPKMLYIWNEKFDARDGAIENLEDEFNSSGNGIPNPTEYIFSSDSRFVELVRRWQKKDGETSRFVASFIIDGIVHVASEQTEWFSAFENEATQLAEALLCERAEQAENLRSASVESLRRMARRLVEDPRFNAPKASRAKREYLASTLFPDIDDRTIRLAVEEAENLSWLDANRGNPKV